jgi:predicted metalloendopeptidase
MRSFSEIDQRNEALLREILESAANGKSGTDPLTKKLGDYYAACMAEDRIESAAPAELATQLKRIEAVTGIPQLAKELAHIHLDVASPSLRRCSPSARSRTSRTPPR